MAGFKPGSVVYCAYGSESPLQQNEFQELLLGLELAGFPFLVAPKPRIGFESIEEALPKGFSERVQGRGIAYGGWVHQQLILGHPSVGCFVTHWGAASITEALVNECQLVLLPRLGSDHIMNARMVSSKLKVGVEVKGEEDGLFKTESVCQALKIVMDDENELGREGDNHTKLEDHHIRLFLFLYLVPLEYIFALSFIFTQLLPWFTTSKHTLLLLRYPKSLQLYSSRRTTSPLVPLLLSIFLLVLIKIFCHSTLYEA